MRSGWSKAPGILIALGVISSAALIVGLTRQRVLAERNLNDDIRNIRKVFAATIIYSNLNDDRLPPSLDLTRNQFDDPSVFLASGDPYKDDPNKTWDGFPIDPAFPDSKKRVPYRISFTYLPQWILQKGLASRDWKQATQNGYLGDLACYWYGDHGSRPDGLDSRGPVVRVGMDGSIKKIDVPGGTLLSADDLFGKKN